MDLMTFLKKLFHEICQKGLKNDLSMLSVAPIIINTPMEVIDMVVGRWCIAYRGFSTLQLVELSLQSKKWSEHTIVCSLCFWRSGGVEVVKLNIIVSIAIMI